MAPASEHRPTPNVTFRALRGALSPGEFASLVRRAAREIGEQVSCDARYVGRVESGEIQCPNYAYERVFRHMFPGRTLHDLGFAPRDAVRRRRPTATSAPDGDATALRPWQLGDDVDPFAGEAEAGAGERASTRLVVVPEPRAPGVVGGAPCTPPPSADGLPGILLAPGAHQDAVRRVVGRLRALDDRHGADAYHADAERCLDAAHRLLDDGPPGAAAPDELQAAVGELAVVVAALAHDAGRPLQARSCCAEALATARLTADHGLEAHAFSATSLLARDLGRHREAVCTARAGQRAARRLASPRLLALLTLREAAGLAGLGDRPGCERRLADARRLFAQGVRTADPGWLSAFDAAELAGLSAWCWSALGEFGRAVEQAGRAVERTPPHRVRDATLHTAELAHDLTGADRVAEAARQGHRVLDRLRRQVDSARVRGMLATTTRALWAYRSDHEVAGYLDAYRAHRDAAPLRPAPPAR